MTKLKVENRYLNWYMEVRFHSLRGEKTGVCVAGTCADTVQDRSDTDSVVAGIETCVTQTVQERMQEHVQTQTVWEHVQEHMQTQIVQKHVQGDMCRQDSVGTSARGLNFMKHSIFYSYESLHLINEIHVLFLSLPVLMLPRMACQFQLSQPLTYWWISNGDHRKTEMKERSKK